MATEAGDEGLKVRVESGTVTLNITLTPKFLSMPLTKALLGPFIKAYNKKEKDCPVSLESLTAVSIAGGAWTGPVPLASVRDEETPSSTILGSQEGVAVTLTFAEQAMPMFTEGMSEVEKLKAKRRAENAAKRAAAGGDAPADASGSAPASAPAPAPAPAPPMAAEPGALGQIAKAEAKAAEMEAAFPEVTQMVATAAADATALDAAAKKQAALSAGLGQLTAMMDEIDLGEIEDDDARGAARARRKAINKRCALASSGDVEVDGDLAAANTALKKALVAARAALK